MKHRITAGYNNFGIKGKLGKLSKTRFQITPLTDLPYPYISQIKFLIKKHEIDPPAYFKHIKKETNWTISICLFYTKRLHNVTLYSDYN